MRRSCMKVNQSQTDKQIADERKYRDEKRVTFDTDEPETKPKKQTKCDGTIRPDKTPAVKMQVDKYEEWNKWKYGNDKKQVPIKQQIVCHVCLSPTCDSLGKVKLVAALESNEDKEEKNRKRRNNKVDIDNEQYTRLQCMDTISR